MWDYKQWMIFELQGGNNSFREDACQLTSVCWIIIVIYLFITILKATHLNFYVKKKLKRAFTKGTEETCLPVIFYDFGFELESWSGLNCKGPVKAI